MAYIYDLTDTWNAGGTTFYGIKMNVTNTASASGSKLLSLQVGGSEQFGVDKDGAGYFSGNVGIGTATPTPIWGTTVQVGNGTGNGTFSIVGNGGSGFMAMAGSNFQLIARGSTPLQFGSNDVVQMTLGTGGHLGIGTSNPGTRLDVWTPNGTATTVRWAQTGVTNYDWRIPASTDAFTLNYGGSTERMRITSTGDVGIGTSSPLSVGGYKTLTLDGAGGGAVAFNANGVIAGSIAPYTNDMYYDAVDATIFRNGAAFNGTPTERMRITGVGNLGIGTTAPNALLTVSNGGAAGYEINPTGGVGGGATVVTYNRNTSAYTSLTTYSSTMTWYANGSTRAMDLDSSGNLGIGTSSPGAKLHVDTGASSGTALIVGATSASSSQINMGIGVVTTGRPFIGTNTNTNPLEIGTRNAIELMFLTNATERARIDASGNVGIGTSAPGAKLDVSSTTNNIVVSRSTSGYAAFQRVAPSGQQAYDFYTINGVEAGRITVDGGNFMAFSTGASATERMRITAGGDIWLGQASLPTNATTGFPYIPTCAGTPTGTPAGATGFAPMVVDSTNNKLYVYIGGAWQAMN